MAATIMRWVKLIYLIYYLWVVCTERVWIDNTVNVEIFVQYKFSSFLWAGSKHKN